jgi:hypothetical protein
MLHPSHKNNHDSTVSVSLSLMSRIETARRRPLATGRSRDMKAKNLGQISIVCLNLSQPRTGGSRLMLIPVLPNRSLHTYSRIVIRVLLERASNSSQTLHTRRRPSQFTDGTTVAARFASNRR